MKDRSGKWRKLRLFVLAIMTFAGSVGSSQAGPGPKIKAVVFDAFVIFDPRPIPALAERLFPGKGAELAAAWRTRQFEYTWIRTVSGDYKDFWEVSADALVYAAKAQKLDLTPEKKGQLMAALKGLRPWPDVMVNLKALKEKGLGLAFLTNLSPGMLDEDIRSSALEGLFDHNLSTDKVRSYKPASKAYQLGVDAFHLRKDEILFVAFAGWDAAGARTFGYPTFWVNRLQLPMEELSEKPNGEGAGLADVVNFLKSF